MDLCDLSGRCPPPFIDHERRWTPPQRHLKDPARVLLGPSNTSEMNRSRLGLMVVPHKHYPSARWLEMGWTL